VFAGAEDGPFEIRNLFVQNSEIVCDPDVMRHSIRQPDWIIGNPGTDPPARRGEPPMLKVSFDKLASGGTKKMFPC
jgi:hypothetical protein